MSFCQACMKHVEGDLQEAWIKDRTLWACSDCRPEDFKNKAARAGAINLPTFYRGWK